MAKKRKRTRDHSLRRLRALMCETPWSIHAPMLDTLGELLELRAEGHELDSRTIHNRLGLGEDFPATTQMVGKIAVIPITGVMRPKVDGMVRWFGGTSTEVVERDFRQAVANANVDAVVFYCDSGGGSAMGNKELAEVIRQARGQKPIVTFVRGFCASAAYYVGSAADRIVATASSALGSIGSVMVHSELSTAYEEFGIGNTVIVNADSPRKADGNQYEPLEGDARKSLDKWVNTFGEQFIDDVATNRGVSRSDVLNRFGRGEMFLAPEALQRGMIDEISDWETLLKSLGASGDNSNSGRMSGQLSAISDQPDFQTHNQVQANAPGITSTGRASGTPEQSTMDPKIKAALFARGLIDSVEASDDVCKAVLAGWFGVNGGQIPGSDAETLKALNGPSNQNNGTGGASGTPTTNNQQPTTQQPAGNVQEAHEREMREARQEAAQQALQRADQIRERAAVLARTGFTVSDEQITAAVNNTGQSIAEVVDGWLQAQPSQTTQQRDAERGITITPAGSEADNVTAAAIDGLRLRFTPDAVADQQLNPHARQFSRLRMMDIVRADMRARNVRTDSFLDDEAVASLWLASGGQQFLVHSEQSIASPADYPNLLTGFMNTMVDDSIRLQATTYRRWTRQHPSVEGLDPHVVVGTGEMGLLEDLTDDDVTPQDKISEEALSWFKVERKGKKVPLTAEMVARDKLMVFVNQFGDLQVSQELTIEELCIQVLVSNRNMLDGNALFDDTNHGNDVEVGTGGAPSATQAELMRKKMRRQSSLGQSRQKVELVPRIWLGPPEHEEAARQTYLSIQQLAEAKVAQTDATINVHRGSLSDLIVLTRLENFERGTKRHYLLADPALMAAVKVVYQRGFEGGRTDTWFDPDRQTRYFRRETRVAAFANHYRGILRNEGPA